MNKRLVVMTFHWLLTTYHYSLRHFHVNYSFLPHNDLERENTYPGYTEELNWGEELSKLTQVYIVFLWGAGLESSIKTISVINGEGESAPLHYPILLGFILLLILYHYSLMRGNKLCATPGIEEADGNMALSWMGLGMPSRSVFQLRWAERARLGAGAPFAPTHAV